MMRIITVVLIITCATSAFAQEYGDSLSPHQIGITASSISGYGASYSYILSKDFRIKSAFFAYYEDQGYSNAYNWTGIFGLELQYTLQSSSMTRFYGLLGGYYYHYENHYDNSFYSESNSYTNSNTTNTEKTFTVGIGVGFEILLWRHLTFNLDIGFEFDASKHSTDYDPVPTTSLYVYDNYNRKYFSIAGGAGIGYRF